MKNQYAVIGLGRFGSSIATKLYEAGHEVLAIDKNEHIVDEYRDGATHVLVCDTTEEETLKAIGIKNFDTVIVAIGDDIQASILTTLILKELGISKVVAKALNNRHAQVLYKVGADQVVFPERDMGERVAQQLMLPNVLNILELANGYSVEEIQVPVCMVHATLKELDLRAKYNMSVIAIKSGSKLDISPAADRLLHPGDVLVAIGENKDLERFANMK